MRPISKNLLIHTVSIEVYQDDTGWGSNIEPSVTINKVRVDPQSILRMSGSASSSYDAEAKDVLFIDTTYSMPFIVPTVKSYVTFNSERMIVTSVKPFYNKDRLHHLEIGLK